MRNFFNSHWKVIVAILLAIVLATLTVDTKSSAFPLPQRLQAHAQAFAPASGRGASRHVQTSLARYGYAPRLQLDDGALRSIEASVANTAAGRQADRVFIIGAQLGRDDSTAATAVLELARAFADLQPAYGTEIRFVFFMENDEPTSDNGLALPRERTGSNFIAYLGSRASSQRVSQALASLRSDQMLVRQGLAAPAHVMGVTLSRHDADDGQALVITDAGFLRYPYFRAGAGAEDQTDYDAVARVVSGLTRTLTALAGPVEA